MLRPALQRLSLRLGLAAALLASTLAGLPGAARAETLTLLVMEVPGLFNAAGRGRAVEGRGVELFSRLAREAGVQASFELTVTARAMLDAASRERSCVVGLARTPERVARFKWAGPISRSRLVLLARADDARRWSTLAELVGLRIAAIRHSVVAAQLREAGVAVDEVADDATALRMLLAQRIDLWAAHEMVMRYETRQLGEQAPRIALDVGVLETYLACHPQTSDALMARLQAAVALLTREGAFTTLKR